MIRLAVIGSGGHARAHHGVPLSHFKERLELAAVCGKDLESAKKFASDFGFAKVYSDVDAMIGEVKPEALVVVTPVAVNFPLAKKLIPFGIPLLIEKPPGMCPEETAELLELAESRGTKVMVSFNRRFAPPLARMAGWLEKHGSMPVLMRTEMLRVGRSEAEFIEATAIHSLDVIVAFLGEPVEVEAGRVQGACPNARLARIGFGDGSSCEFTLNPETGSVQELYEIIGRDFRLEANFINGEFTAWQKGKLEDHFKTPECACEAEMHGSLGETDHFLTCLEKGLPFKPDLRHGLAVMKLAGALESAPAPLIL